MRKKIIPIILLSSMLIGCNTQSDQVFTDTIPEDTVVTTEAETKKVETKEEDLKETMRETQVAKDEQIIATTSEITEASTNNEEQPKEDNVSSEVNTSNSEDNYSEPEIIYSEPEYFSSEPENDSSNESSNESSEEDAVSPEENVEYSEPATEAPTEYYEKDIIIREYGSYAAYEKSFIEAINRIRVENGNAPLVENTYMNQTSEVLADYCISVHKIGHFGSNDSSVFDNLRRGLESVGSFSKRKVIDADQMAWELTTDHTYQIVTEPEMKYIGVSVKNFNGQNAVLVINAISEESYQNTVIGPYPYTEITHGEMHTYHSRFCPQELWK